MAKKIENGKALKIVITIYTIFFISMAIMVFGIQQQTAITNGVDGVLMGVKLSYFIMSMIVSMVISGVATILIFSKKR